MGALRIGKTCTKASEEIYKYLVDTTTSSLCERMPDRQSLSVNNLYWQTFVIHNISFYLFNAYYDNRYRSPVRPAIRITAMIDIKNPPELYCQIWYSSVRPPVIMKVHSYEYMWFKHWNMKRELQPFLITCPIPQKFSKFVPQHVSLIHTNDTCQRKTNLLKVMYNRPLKGKQKFSVCVKGMDFPEDKNGTTSARLIAWLETLWLLGVNQVFFYVLHIHPNIRAVLQHYAERGRVQILPLTLPGNQPNEAGLQHSYLNKMRRQKRLNEVIPYNDCFYRNLYLYEYVALMDTDEMIVPLAAGSTWSEMLKNVIRKAKKTCKKKGGWTSYMARNFYFMDDFHENHGWFADIPRYMYMLQHVHRTANDTYGRFLKGLHRTDAALTLHNHMPFRYLRDVCQYFVMSADDVKLHHYRSYCVNDIKRDECEALRKSVVKDTTMWRYKQTLIERTTETLRAVGLLDKNYSLTLIS